MIAFFAELGVERSHENFRVGSTSGNVAWAMVEQGLRLSLMADQVARRCPAVERAVSALEAVRFPIWLATHRELHTSRRIRLVFDLLAGFLSKDAVLATVPLFAWHWRGRSQVKRF